MPTFLATPAHFQSFQSPAVLYFCPGLGEPRVAAPENCQSSRRFERAWARAISSPSHYSIETYGVVRTHHGQP